MTSLDLQTTENTDSNSADGEKDELATQKSVAIQLPLMATLIEPFTTRPLERWRPVGSTATETLREIWMPSSLMTKINTRWSAKNGHETANQAEARWDDTQAFLTSFITGSLMSIGSENDKCDIKVITPQRGSPWSAWELRPVPKRPKTRIFGAFLDSMNFVAHECFAKYEFQRTGRMSQNNRADISLKWVKQLCTPLEWNETPIANELGGERNRYYDQR
jgi:hypothetical protein